MRDTLELVTGGIHEIDDAWISGPDLFRVEGKRSGGKYPPSGSEVKYVRSEKN